MLAKRIIIGIFVLAGMLLLNTERIYAQGCASPSSEEGVTVWGYLQPELNTYFEDETRVQFGFRRMRLGVMGNIPYDFGYYVLLETSQFLNPDNNSPFLLDAFITYNRFEYARFAIGSFKYPFGLELGQTGCHQLYTIRRSRIVDEMTANYRGTSNRDIGFQMLGGNATSFFSYQVAITSGYGIQLNDEQKSSGNLLDSYAVTGRVAFQPISGFKVGVSGRTGQHPAEAEGVENPDTKVRYGVDVSYFTSNWMIQGEYISGEDQGSYTAGGGCDGGAQTMIGTQNTNGWYMMAAYKFPFNLEPVYKVESYESNTGSNEAGSPTVGASSMIQTFGLNFYPNDWTRLQMNYVYSSEDPAEINNDALLLQVQVKF